MVTYHYRPIQEPESIKIERALNILKGVIAREDKLHMMDQHLTSSMRDLLESEIIPSLENELNFDGTPEHLWDDTGGEPPVTLDEMHTAALQRKAQGQWLRTSEAIVVLQTSRKTMTRRIKDGYFVFGDHYVQTGPHKTAAKIWNIQRCRETQARWDGPSSGF